MNDLFFKRDLIKMSVKNTHRQHNNKQQGETKQIKKNTEVNARGDNAENEYARVFEGHELISDSSVVMSENMS